MSRSGRYVVVAEVTSTGAKLEVVDAIGTAPRVLLRDALPDDFAVVGEQVWLVAQSKLTVASFAGNEVASVPIREPSGVLLPALRGDANSAVWRHKSGAELISLDAGQLTVEPIDEAFGGADVDLLVSLHGKRVLSVSGREYQLAVVGRGLEHRGGLPGDGVARSAAEILGGKAIAIVSATQSQAVFDVIRPRGSLIHHVELGESSCFAFAEVRGLGLAYADGELVAVDLRYGRVVHSATPPLAPLAIDIDSEGRHVVMAGYHEGATRLSVYHVPFADVFQLGGGSRALASPETEEVEDAAKPEIEISESPEAVPEPPVDDDVEIPNLPLLALRSEPEFIAPVADDGAAPYEHPSEHLADLLDLVIARTASAIANAWDSGELSQPLTEGLPFEKEVRALIGHRAGAAPQLVTEAGDAVERIALSIASRTRATLAIGLRLPLYEISRQFGLSTTATQIVAVVAAPSLRREAARLYGILSNDTARPVCDRALVETILGEGVRGGRGQVRAELDAAAPLLEHGLLRIAASGTSERLFAALSVDSVLLRRLIGDDLSAVGPGAVTSIEHATCEFEDLTMPDRVKREIVVALAEPTARAPRLVVRGRPGFGRTTLFAALADRVELPLAVIDTERLPSGETFPMRLRDELQRARLRGALPCVRGLENRAREEFDQSEHVREIFRSYSGPIFFRTSVEFNLPLDPGFVSVTLPTLLESERHAVWEEALAARGVTGKSVAPLAARYRVGPGTIESIVHAAEARLTGSKDVVGDLDKAARQHLEARLGDVATRVKRLARWEQVALPDDMIDSIREFIGRVMHRRTVYERWGFADKMATSRGLTALFYGQPGTGKTMVAGLIARELGLDLYRVDLANITSKWIGETEKNLARVFDAAEDGQAVILFDEADSLFAKRTEVKSSVDRYANLEVNYLLQRFDSFEGVAILTTNMDGSIDSAFKRRLSLRLEFPFPDEEMRVRLWAAHIPSQAPTRGDFDFVSLAKRFPMSGGYIRNSALRAAFLAAQEDAPLAQEHLERAIALEYREMGKLSTGGRMA